MYHWERPIEILSGCKSLKELFTEKHLNDSEKAGKRLWVNFIAISCLKNRIKRRRNSGKCFKSGCRFPPSIRDEYNGYYLHETGITGILLCLNGNNTLFGFLCKLLPGIECLGSRVDCIYLAQDLLFHSIPLALLECLLNFYCLILFQLKGFHNTQWKWTKQINVSWLWPVGG